MQICQMVSSCSYYAEQDTASSGYEHTYSHTHKHANANTNTHTLRTFNDS